MEKPKSTRLADPGKPIRTAIANTDDEFTVNDVPVVRRIALQLFSPPIADGGRLGMDTRLPNDSATSGGYGGSALRSPSNMKVNRKIECEKSLGTAALRNGGTGIGPVTIAGTGDFGAKSRR